MAQNNPNSFSPALPTLSSYPTFPNSSSYPIFPPFTLTPASTLRSSSFFSPSSSSSASSSSTSTYSSSTSSQPPHHHVDYHEEFRLISSRYLMSIDDITPEEIQLWMEHIKNEGYKVDDPREFFDPAIGDELTFVNEEVNTDELRVRHWLWTCRKGKNEGETHELIDINSWPGDNECGIIAIDGVTVINNGNCHLQFKENSSNSLYSDFELRLPFFQELRTNLDEEDEDEGEENDSVLMSIKEFRESEYGKQAIEIEKAGSQLYSERLNTITTENNRLKALYVSEFSFMYTKFDGSYWTDAYVDKPSVHMVSPENVAEQIGYQFVIYPFDRFDFNNTYPDTNPIFYKFVKWTPGGGEGREGSKSYILVDIRDRYESRTYLLNEAGKIECQVFDKAYLAKDDGKRTELVLMLHSRIHSYLGFLENLPKSG